MKCSACGSEYTSQFCPNCGSSQNTSSPSTDAPKSKQKKPFFKKWWFWLIIVVVIAGIGTGSSSDETATNQVTTSTTEVENTATSAQNTPEDSEVIPEGSVATTEPQNIAYGVGDTVTAKSYDLTIQSFGVIESDNQFIQPDDGYVFIEVGLLIENTSSSDLSVSSLLHFNAYVDDFSTSLDLSALAANDNGSLDGTVAAGKKLQGSLAYQVPEDWQNFELIVNLGFVSSNEVTLLFQS